MINSGRKINTSARNNLFNNFGFLFTLLIVLSIGILSGCEKKTETTGDQTGQKDTSVTSADTAARPVDTAAQVQKPAVTVPDLKGTWSGTLASRATTLKITSQDSVSFKGSITINFREAVHQQVSGKIDPKTMQVTMKDVVRARSAGSYAGKLSADGSKFSGTFTQNLDGQKANFNLTKK